MAENTVIFTQLHGVKTAQGAKPAQFNIRTSPEVRAELEKLQKQIRREDDLDINFIDMFLRGAQAYYDEYNPK